MSEIVEHPEYNNSDNPYPSFGKRYCGERAIISLTSWKMRIHTVAKTLYSLYTMCPGFHIVLVLSEEEFPKMCEELPENLMLFVENEMIELLWVYKNYKAFKKWAFTADKYRDVPIISADDDCIYTCNYAQKLFNKWNTLKDKKTSIRWSYYKGHLENPSGPTNLYFGINDIVDFIKSLSDKIIQKSLDDDIIGSFIKRKKIKCNYVSKDASKPFIFHNEFKPLHNYKNSLVFKKCYGK